MCSGFWRQIGICGRRWGCNIKMDVKELGYISLVQHRNEGRHCVKKVPDLRFIQMARYFIDRCSSISLLGRGLIHGARYLKSLLLLLS